MLLLLVSRFSHVRLCATSWTAANQAPQSMGFSRQEYWSGVPSPSPEEPHILRERLLPGIQHPAMLLSRLSAKHAF